MVAFDNTILSVLLFPDAVLQEGPDAKPVERARERVNALVQEIAEGGEQVLVPSPALAEILATPDWRTWKRHLTPACVGLYPHR